MSFVFKQLDPSEIYVTPFYAYKTIRINNSNASSSYGMHVYQCQYTQSHVNLRIDSPTSTADGLGYKFLSHASIKNLYYEDFDIKPNEKLDYYNKNERRELHEKATAFSIPQNIFGERIKENTFELTASGYNLQEDGYGNLIDLDRYTTVGNLRIDSENYLIGEWNFNDGYIYGENLVTESFIRNIFDKDNSIIVGNVKFLDGPYGKSANFYGKTSIIKVTHYDRLNFKYNDNFLLTGFIELPDSQSYTGTNFNYIIKKGITSGSYPYSLQIANQNHSTYAGKLRFSRYDGINLVELTSSISINDNIRRHIAIRKSGSNLQMFIDGTLDSTTTDICIGDTINNESLYIGYGLTGSLDELRLYNNPLTRNQVESMSLYESASNWNYYVGNIFYKTGMVVITSPYSEYTSLVNDTGSYSLQFKSSKKITEYEIICQIEGDEFNSSVNPSLGVRDTNNHLMYNANIVNSSSFSPYVTQIGLYNDSNEMIAIAKPSQPIKIPINKDLSFVVKFDV